MTTYENIKLEQNDKPLQKNKNYNNKSFILNEKNIELFNTALKNKRTKSLMLSAFFSAIAITITFLFFNEALIFILFATLILVLSSFKSYLNNKQYHSLEGATKTNGSHQCLFCGNTGVYKSTVYKTHITECSCSQCEKHLYNE